jgi:hypothetical protein
LGQFKLPVTITPTSNTIFFIDPRNDGIGNDNFPGTAARPWRSVAKALTGTATTGSRVATVASAGNDVVVTILAGGTETGIASNISTPNLPAGSVTVLKAPSAGTFTLNMGDKTLTLNEGYKLQDIDITSNFTSSSGSVTVVTINAPTAGLASVNVKCEGTSNYTITCVKVTGSGSHTLKDVTVDVKDSNASNIGILIDANANLSIVGGIVKLTAEPNTNNQKPITLIQSDGVLIATGLTVDMTGGNTEHTQGSKGIVLNAARSLVTSSTIKLNRPTTNSVNAIGIDVQVNSPAVEGNTFFKVGGVGGNGNAIGVKGVSRLSSLSRNTFVGFTAPNDKTVDP